MAEHRDLHLLEASTLSPRCRLRRCRLVFNLAIIFRAIKVDSLCLARHAGRLAYKALFVIKFHFQVLINMFNFSDRMLEQFVAKASTDELHQKLNAMAAAMGDAAFGKHVAREIVQRTQPQKAVPEIYNHYRRLVCDGIEFFLSRVSRHRLVELVVNQLKMDPAASSEERLLELAKRFPTLHKLGQIIARNRHIDPAVKQWLVHLENGRYGTPRKGLLGE